MAFVNVPINDASPTISNSRPASYNVNSPYIGGILDDPIFSQPSSSSVSVQTPVVTPSSVAPSVQAYNPGNQVDTSDSQDWTQFTNALKVATDTAAENSALSQQFAREQMQFQADQSAKAMQFSADQAELNRRFQVEMSNTSHQREVQDLIKAGLNPVLSALSGASTPSGSAASGVAMSGASGTVDTTANSLLSSVLNALIGQETAFGVAEIQRQSALMTANINARTQEKISDSTIKNQQYLAREYPSSFASLASSAGQRFAEYIDGTLNSSLTTQSKIKKLLGIFPKKWLHNR